MSQILKAQVVDILVVGAGGGGGTHPNAAANTGGGGGGGVVQICGTSLSNGTYSFSVAARTAGITGSSSATGCKNTSRGNLGANSSFSQSSGLVITAYGGGGGGCNGGSGSSGGSGGGGHANDLGGGITLSTCSGNSGGILNIYGSAGSNSVRTGSGSSIVDHAGGGGGATQTTGNKNGGEGVSVSILGYPRVFGSGGGGSGSTGGIGGTNAGNGANGNATTISDNNGKDTFGGGGGGTECLACTGSVGGSGVIILRYASPNSRLSNISGTGTVRTYSYTGNGTNGMAGLVYQVHVFSGTGSFTFTNDGHITTQPSTNQQNICLNGTSTTLSVASNGSTPTYQWYSKTNSCGDAATLISGATSQTYTPPTNTVGTTYYFCSVTATVGGNSVTQLSGVSGAVIINAPSVAGTVSGGNTGVSGNNSSTLSVSGNTGTVQWQSSSDNINFTNISGATSSTHTVTNLSSTTYYRAAVTNGGCSTVFSNSNSVIITSAPTGTTAPGITLSSSLPLPVTNNQATAVDNQLLVSFTGNLSGFTVTISQNYTTGDELGYGTLPTGITTSGFNTQRRSITFNGSANAATWQSVLRSVTIRTTSATCNPETRKVSFTASTNFYNFFNGHYYEYVSQKKNWTQARDYAASKTFYGRQGYLVVITSAEENAYISQMIGYNTWMGGTDNYKQINAAVGYTKYANQAAAEGNYHWVTGPEKGINFSNRNNSPSIPAGRYCRWQSGEPNNFNTGFYDNNVGAYGEHYMHIYADRKTWNDFPNDRYFACIIEYGGMPGDNPQGTVERTRDITVSVPATGSISGAATVCSGSNSTALTLSGNASGSTVARWESSPDNFLETINSLTSTSTSYTATNLTQTTHFRAVVVNNGCTTVTSSVKITVVDLNAGDIVANSDQVCTGQSATLTLKGLVGSVVRWETTNNTTGTSFTPISNTNTSLTRTVSTNGTHYFRTVVNTNTCSTSDRFSDWYPITATTGSTPIGGEVSSQSHCSVNNSGTLEFTGASSGTYNWQTSTDNGLTWANTSPTNNGLLQTYANVTRNTLFRVQVNNGCNTVNSNIGSITIYGTNKCQWTGATNSDWGTSSNWCNGTIASNGADFDISPEATNNIVLDVNRSVGTINFNGSAKYINLGNYNLFLTNVIGADTLNHIKTNGTGELIARIANNDSFTFNIGAGAFNPVTITNKTGTTDDFEVRVIDNVYDGGTSGTSLNSPRVKRTWLINKVGGSANSGSGIDMSFNWHLTEEAGTITTRRLYHHSGTDWDLQTTGTYSTRARYLIYRGYKGTFSTFAIGDAVTPLPVDLVSFEAKPKNNSVDLNWTSYSDNKNPYNILKSTDGIKWNSIGTLNAADNTIHYLFTDHKPAPINYYQLSQLDNSNTLQYSDIRVVNFNGNTLSVFPNPNNGEFTIQSKHVVQFQISDFTGKVIMEGDNTNPLIKTNFAKGIYFIQITEGDKTTFSKMIVQ